MSDEPADPGLEEWQANASAFDRVRSVAATVSRPRFAPWIAEGAAVAENTARGHLERLVDMNVLQAMEVDGGRRYEPDPLHTRLQAIRELLDTYDHEGLLSLKAELQRAVESWKAEYGVDSPAELRALAAKSESAAETAAIRETAQDWTVVAYRLDVVEEAIERYRQYEDGDVAPA